MSEPPITASQVFGFITQLVHEKHALTCLAHHLNPRWNLYLWVLAFDVTLSTTDKPCNAQPNVNIAKLKRKMDISNLTLQITGENVQAKGRFYMLWRVVILFL